MQLKSFSLWSCFSYVFKFSDFHIECSERVFHYDPDFQASFDKQDLQIWSHIKSSRIVFNFGLDFHVSSD